MAVNDEKLLLAGIVVDNPGGCLLPGARLSDDENRNETMSEFSNDRLDGPHAGADRLDEGECALPGHRYTLIAQVLFHSSRLAKEWGETASHLSFARFMPEIRNPVRPSIETNPNPLFSLA